MALKIEVYYQYANYMISAGYSFSRDVVTPHYFQTIWRNEFPWLKCRRKKSIKHSCDVCADLDVGAVGYA